MQLSVQQMIDKLKQVHPDLYPIWYIEDRGAYMFNLLERGVSKEEAICNFYAVDSSNGTIAGPIPVMSIYGNKDLAAKLEKPHMCSPDEQKSIQHDAIHLNSSFLAHYGIKGQKWGVRRFQNEDGSLTAEGKERYNNSENKEKTSEKKPGFFERQRINQANLGEKWFESMADDSEIIDREKSKKGGVDKSRIAVNVFYTAINPLNAVLFAADGISAGVAKKKESSYFKNREQKSELDPETGLYIKKEGSYNEHQDLAAVNPGYMNMNTNSKSNCMLCTTTYDLRQRGYDVTAQLDSVGYNFASLKKWYPDAKIEKTSRFDENGKPMKDQEYADKTLENLKSQGEGARGNFMMFFKTGGAHSIVYTIKNGNVIFIDGQTATVYDGKISLTNSNPSPKQLLMNTIVNSYARLDNIMPDLQRIKAECVR